MTDRIEGLTGQEDSCTVGQELGLILQGMVRQALRDVVQEEVTALCGPRYRPSEQSEYFCAGTVWRKGLALTARDCGGEQGKDQARLPRLIPVLHDAFQAVANAT